MKELLLDDTIVAISTPVGKSGIGIVRLSGKNALAIADKVFVSAQGKRPSQFPSHSLRYGWIKDIDEVLLTVMHAPRTYTREDIVEINCHSGIVVLKKILELVLSQGARLALPGEFTKRAYLNGRIDLAQAEAVLDIINSQTQDALKAALGQLQGRLSGKISGLRNNLLEILAQLELSIDFSDQEAEPWAKDKLLENMQAVQQEIRQLLDSAEKGTILRQGATCVICGKPNVGKSSLLNAFLKRERAIVTALAGTTRDILEETIDLQGIPLRLIDTAGIIRGKNIAEQEAVKRAQEYIREAALVLLVIDSSRNLTAEDQNIARSLSAKQCLVVLNKLDLPAKVTKLQAGKLLPGRKVVSVSALCGTGIEQLGNQIADLIWQGKVQSNGEILVTNLRHQQAIKRADKLLQQAINSQRKDLSSELVTLDVQGAQKCLSEICGQISGEDILQRIFSEFCIGK